MKTVDPVCMESWCVEKMPDLTIEMTDKAGSLVTEGGNLFRPVWKSLMNGIQASALEKGCG